MKKLLTNLPALRMVFGTAILLLCLYTNKAGAQTTQPATSDVKPDLKANNVQVQSNATQQQQPQQFQQPANAVLEVQQDAAPAPSNLDVTKDVPAAVGKEEQNTTPAPKH